MYSNRIKHPGLRDKIMTAQQAAMLFKNNMVVGCSGFTKAGDSKAVLLAIAERAVKQPLKITLITGASLGHETDGVLTNAHVLQRRMPFQTDPVLRKSINNGEVMFIDQHLSETIEQIKIFPSMDIAVLEAALIEEDGAIVPTTSVGNSAAFAQQAKQLIIEINLAVPMEIKGIHDIYATGDYPDRKLIPITNAASRIGGATIGIDPAKIAGIVITDIPDSPADTAAADPHTTAIAAHLSDFFHHEIKKGRLTKSLLPLQAGIGKIANGVLHGFLDSDFENLTMYSEVLQDSTFDLIDAGKLLFASGSSITVSAPYYHKIFDNIEKYRNRIVLRSQNITNAAEVIRRLGVIAINTAMECDIYGNVNSTHTGGTHMMNGIGGSGDFARNAYMSIFVSPSTTKLDTISRIVPMIPHVDHTEHDVDIIVTENGLADLRGLAPRERAIVIINNCPHKDYKDALQDYFSRALQGGGQTPHILQEAFSWYRQLQQTGSMKMEKHPVCTEYNQV
ncbi:MAG: succinate CoA transferase [Bacteroidota bacterium]